MYNEDIFELAGDLNTPLITPELHNANDFYGHAHILKQYAGLPEDYPLKAVIEHAPSIPEALLDFEMNTQLPFVCTFNTGSANHIYKKTKKVPVVIGPMIAYARPYFSEKKTKNMKKRLGKNLLVYPYHSTHHCYNKYDYDTILNQIKREEKNYDSITINIYWSDITKENVKFYSKQGYYCTTCGHMYDNLFLNRQRTLLDISDGVLVFDPQTSIYFATHLDKRLKVIDNASTTYGNKIYQETYIIPFSKKLEDGETLLEKIEKYYSTVKKNFKEMVLPSGALKETLSYVCEFDEVKTPEEIRCIFAIAEDMYKKKGFFKKQNFTPIEILQYYQKTKQEEKRQAMLNYLHKINVL